MQSGQVFSTKAGYGVTSPRETPGRLRFKNFGSELPQSNATVREEIGRLELVRITPGLLLANSATQTRETPRARSELI